MSTLRTLAPPVHVVSTEVAAGAAAPAGWAAWRAALARPAFCISWLVLLGLLFGMVVPLTPGFFQLIEQRPGPVLADPLLHLLPRHDVATAVFVLIYGAVLGAVGWLVVHPRLFLRGLWGYCLLTLLRMASIWLVPLSPPLDMLSMPDPFTATFFHTGAAITKDLFFSGHTSTVVILALAVRGRWLRGALFAAAAIIGLLVLVQRVHYSYDVLAAPFFAWAAYWLAGRITWPATRPAAAPLVARHPQLSAAERPLERA